MTESQRDVVLNFRMDGQLQYAQTLSQINMVMSTAAKEYQNHILAMGRDADATEKLRAEKQKLETQLTASSQKVEMLREEFEAMQNDSSATAEDLQKLYNKLLQAENAHTKLEQAMARVNEGLTEEAISARDAQKELNKLKDDASTLDAEQRRLTSAFELQRVQLGENASEAERAALAQEQYTQQMNLARRAVDNLEQQLEAARRAYGDNSREVMQLETRLNQARSEMTRFERGLDDVEESADGAEGKLDKLGGGLQALAGAVPIAAVAALVESTKELSTELARLQSNAEAWGFTGSVVEDAFKKVAAVSGDTGAAVETLSNLMSTDFSDNQLAEAIEHINGAYIQFSDTLSTEGIADGIQETFAVGEAAGSFAELLERSGMSLETFNEGLVKAQKNGTETDYVLQTLADTGVKSFYESYKESNKALVEASEAEIEHQMALKKLGDTLRPLVTEVTQFTTKIIEWANENPKLAAGIASSAAAIGIFVTAFATLTPAITGIIGAISGAGGLSAALAAVAGPAGWVALTVAALAALGIGAYKLVEDLKQPSLQANILGKDISEATQEAVGSFLELNDQASVALKELDWTGKTVSQETADAIVSSFSGMAEQTRQALETRNTEALSLMQNFMTDSVWISEQEKEQILTNMNDKYTQQQEAITNGENIIKEIMQTASDEKRALTEAEKIQINNIQEGMVQNGITILSQNEVEAKSIMERMKANAETLSAQQAAEVVKNSVKQKDEAVAAAEEQYDKTVQEIIRQRDELGTITADQAHRMITEAKKQRDETVKHAEDMHADVVEEAKKQAKEHADQVDWETGEVKSKWQVLKDDISDRAKEIKEDVSRKWKEISGDASKKWDEIKAWPGKKLEEAKSDVKEKMGDIRDKIKEIIEEIKEFFSGMKLEMPKIKMPKLPHFKLKGDFSLDPPSVPKLSIDWYAKGGILTEPTIFGRNGNRLMAGGEAGPEAVLPLNSNTLGQIGKAIADTMELNSNTQYPSTIVVQSVLDGRVIGESIVDVVSMKQQSNLQSTLRTRGVKK